MKEQFVPYDIALKLKELDFDEPCLAMFSRVGELFSLDCADYDSLKGCNNSDLNYYYPVSAPLFQQAFEWLRKKHNLVHNIDTLHTGNEMTWAIWINRIGGESTIWNMEFAGEYFTANQKCLEKLIEIVNE